MESDIATAAATGMATEREIEEVQGLSVKMFDAIAPVVADLPLLRVASAATHMVGSIGSSRGTPRQRAALLRAMAAALRERADKIERRGQ